MWQQPAAVAPSPSSGVSAANWWEAGAEFQHGPHEKASLLGSKYGPNLHTMDDGLYKDANHHSGDDDSDEADHHEKQAGMSKHHCTDIICVVIFLVAVAGLGILGIYARVEGDTRRLTHGYNFTGHLCGVDEPGKPYLYWCQKPGRVSGGAGGPISLDLRHPICVQTCPTSYATNHTCFSKAEKVRHHAKDAGNGLYYYEETNRFVFASVNDYASKPYLDRFCLPEDTALMAQLMQALNSHGMMKWLMEFQQLSNAWVPLTCAVIFAIILGYVYLLILDKMATCMVYASIALIVILSTFTGLYLIISYFTGGVDGISNTGDTDYNLWAGFGLLFTGLFFGCLSWCMRDGIEVAIGCVQTAADCMFDMPSLLLEPLIAVAVKIFIGIWLLNGFVWLSSVGKVKTMTLAQFTETYEAVPDAKASGVFRTFQYHDSHYWCMLYYVVVGIWILCLMTALSQFVLAYCVQLWYFTPIIHDHKDAPSFPLFRGYYIGVIYHIGSLAYGSFVVTLLTVVRIALGSLAKAAEGEGNPCLAILARCFFCCISCYQRCIEFLNKTAYMDIAINSTSFCTAVANAQLVIGGEIEAITFLHGATFVFTLTGYALITSSSTFLVWIMVRSLYWFNNVESSWYVHDPIVICCIAAFVSFIIAIGFMVVFDMVADTVLFCFATEERRKERNLLPKDAKYAPASLENLIGHHRSGTDAHLQADSSALSHDGHEDSTLDANAHPAAIAATTAPTAAVPAHKMWG